jgi:DNA-binding protein HU-beta
MNKAALAEAIGDRLGVSKKQAEEMIEAFVDITTDTLMKREDVTIAGFGTYTAKFRSARMGVNPQQPSERIRVPAVIIPKFKAGKNLKDALKTVPAEEQTTA